jgi:hypothetical protein
VAMDGGRLQIRTPPVADTGAGAAPARAQHGREDKVGCLLSRAGAASGDDPCPAIPSVLVTPERAVRLAQGIGPGAVPDGAAPPGEATAPAEPRVGRPAVVLRTGVASRQDSEGFGPQRARAAWGRGCVGAAGVRRRWFPHVVPVRAFLHAVSYVGAAAWAGRSFAEGWPVYRRWLEALGAGVVAPLQEERARRPAEGGVATPVAGAPRRRGSRTRGPPGPPSGPAALGSLPPSGLAAAEQPWGVGEQAEQRPGEGDGAGLVGARSRGDAARAGGRVERHRPAGRLRAAPPVAALAGQRRYRRSAGPAPPDHVVRPLRVKCWGLVAKPPAAKGRGAGRLDGPCGFSGRRLAPPLRAGGVSSCPTRPAGTQ